MTPSAAEREALFQEFARALFKHDMVSLYKVVSPDFVWRYHDGLSSGVVVTRHLEERKAFYSTSRFDDVVYYHLPDTSFMTFNVTEIVRSTGEHRKQSGVERYTFLGGRIAIKDVYRKPV